MKKTACLAITLVNPREPQLASSYLWCKLDKHETGMHVSYCGMWWLTTDMVEPTENMIAWRTGSKEDVERVSGCMLGTDGSRQGRDDGSIHPLPDPPDLQGRRDEKAA